LWEDNAVSFVAWLTSCERELSFALADSDWETKNPRVWDALTHRERQKGNIPILQEN
jgi:hypothetical protein